jgi:Trypsin-like serine proteases, typically periplasmic, contain C-terminal PDZ domain
MLTAYESNGYFPIGYSDFTSGRRQFGDGAISQGKRVGADLVVEIDPQYAGQTSTVLPITTPNNSTSYTTGSATAYGPYGSTTAYGTATTRTYGTQTNYVPITIQRVEYGAFYFVKVKTGWGVMASMLTDEQRQELQSNHGVNIAVVVRGTAAYESDILPGDILLTMAGEQVSMPADLHSIEKQHLGQTVAVSLYRRGQVITKQTTVPADIP